MTKAQADHVHERRKALDISFSAYIRLLIDRDMQNR